MTSEVLVPVPWGGRSAELSQQFRDAAMTNPDLTAFAPLTDDPDATHDVTVTWRLSEERAVPVAVELRSRLGEPITGEAWRGVRVAEVISWSRHRLGWVAEQASRRLTEREHPDAATVAEASETLNERPRAGRPAEFGPEHYQRVAALYVAARESGSRTALKDVARALEAEHPDDPRYAGLADSGNYRVKGWVNRARTLGYIETRRG